MNGGFRGSRDVAWCGLERGTQYLSFLELFSQSVSQSQDLDEEGRSRYKTLCHRHCSLNSFSSFLSTIHTT